MPLVTIDGETAKDFDDAVYCERQGKRATAPIVAIADVSHYVDAASALGQGCLRPQQLGVLRAVIPMLPLRSSPTACARSQPRVRAAMVADMAIAGHRRFKNRRFTPR